MKLIMRADDLGFSDGVNCGIKKAVHDGLITSVGLMTNMPSAKSGYELIKEEDIALGQHTNICVGKPLSDPKLIPSLVQEDGGFYSSKTIRQRPTDTVVLAEAEIEIEAQLAKFREITGKDPDYFECHAVFSKNFLKALEKVAQKHKLFFENPVIDKDWEEEHQIFGFDFPQVDRQSRYDIKSYFENQYQKHQDKPVCVAVFHPGYLDQYILDNSSYTFIRPMECAFLCSDWLKKWLKDKNIELIDFRDCQK